MRRGRQSCVWHVMRQARSTDGSAACMRCSMPAASAVPSPPPVPTPWPHLPRRRRTACRPQGHHAGGAVDHAGRQPGGGGGRHGVHVQHPVRRRPLARCCTALQRAAPCFKAVVPVAQLAGCVHRRGNPLQPCAVARHARQPVGRLDERHAGTARLPPAPPAASTRRPCVAARGWATLSWWTACCTTGCGTLSTTSTWGSVRVRAGRQGQTGGHARSRLAAPGGLRPALCPRLRGAAGAARAPLARSRHAPEQAAALAGRLLLWPDPAWSCVQQASHAWRA